eukprot:TRINITY_DN11707_c0_g1_i1.p1 TRINITY_DN11707_c0_g1~~TRINITY_DN11707_c0_g1_i1.p1  ORF type:complete len:344 (-),score=82.69 TRINITY_DN11707_c0_g1_i1:81-1112(-)
MMEDKEVVGEDVKTISLTDQEEKGEEQLEKFVKEKKVGEGTYAMVYKAKNKENGKVYALKEIRMESTGEEGVPFTVIREISLLKRLKHPNIVRLYQVINTEKKGMTLVFEFLYCDLKKYMDARSGILPPKIIKSFLYQLFKGTAFCHTNHVLHRDLKPQNLLINEEGELKLADFGLARFNGIPVARLSSQVVTLWYRPPEVLLGSHKYSTTVDIWSIGCIFAEMVGGTPLFRGSNDEDQTKEIFKTLGTPTEEEWPGFKELAAGKKNVPSHVYKGKPVRSIISTLETQGYDLLENCMKYDPQKRISAKEAMNHAYFGNVILPPSLLKRYEKLEKDNHKPKTSS